MELVSSVCERCCAFDETTQHLFLIVRCLVNLWIDVMEIVFFEAIMEWLGIK
jgi:hypothetical protein